VTQGREGYLWREREGGGHVPAFSIRVTDTTGAGDAFHGAFALMVAEERSTADSVRIATAVAALKCTRLGSRAGLPTRAELDAFLSTRQPA
jgi:sulfofructose kinase